MNIGVVIGARMRELRKEAGLTLEEVARRMETHRPIVGRLELGIHDQGIGSIVLYARAIGKRPTSITNVLDRTEPSTIDVGAACMVPEENSGQGGASSRHETPAASSSIVDTTEGAPA